MIDKRFKLLDASVVSVAFIDCRNLPRAKGVYCIWQGTRCIYVGKGVIHSRFNPHHRNKAYAIFETSFGRRNNTSDPLGWSEGRTQSWWKPDEWRVEYFECSSSKLRTYFEGLMIFELDPFCNDETYEDRSELRKKAT